MTEHQFRSDDNFLDGVTLAGVAYMLRCDRGRQMMPIVVHADIVGYRV